MNTEAVGSTNNVVIKPRPGNRILHDVIKSVIQWEAEEIYKVCKLVPSLKSSALLNDEKWVLDNNWVFQEHHTNTAHRDSVKMDCVWVFHRRDDPAQTYRLTHEVKTGRFDPFEIKEKYYWWQGSQIWIWGQECYKPKELPRLVRFAPIEYLLPLVILQLNCILSTWGNDE